MNKKNILKSTLTALFLLGGVSAPDIPQDAPNASGQLSATCVRCSFWGGDNGVTTEVFYRDVVDEMLNGAKFETGYGEFVFQLSAPHFQTLDNIVRNGGPSHADLMMNISRQFIQGLGFSVQVDPNASQMVRECELSIQPNEVQLRGPRIALVPIGPLGMERIGTVEADGYTMDPIHWAVTISNNQVIITAPLVRVGAVDEEPNTTAISVTGVLFCGGCGGSNCATQ